MILRFKNFICKNILYNTTEAKPYFFIIGLVLAVSFTAFYVLNKFFIATNSYENFYFRAVVVLLGISLMLYELWPKALLSRTPIIFHLILFISFPFFFSFMLFKNYDSNIWQINGIVGLVLLTFFTDWLIFFIMTVAGITLSCLLTYPDHINSIHPELIKVFLSYSAPIIYFIIFSNKRTELQKERSLHEQQIRELNLSLEQKVQERTAKLEAALASKTEFLNNMSHEVRTPVHGFMTFSQSLSEFWDDHDDQKRKEIAKQITVSAQRLASLVGNLLDLAKFNEGKMILDLKNFDLKLSTEDMIEECKILYLQGKKIDFEIINSCKSTNIKADSEKTSQVLRNLFSNSVKFSPTGSKIVASISDVDGSSDGEIAGIKFTLKDQGVGIPESELESIFEPFVQSTRTKTKAGGTGLGLSICYRIMEAHQGKIWAKNNIDSGTSFSFIIPESRIVAMKENDDNETIPNANILMIDDDNLVLRSTTLMLESVGFKVVQAESGVQGLEYLDRNPTSIDLILLDLMMPGMNGFEVLDILKSDRRFVRIPVIMQSGTSEEKDIDDGFSKGIVSFLHKPYKMNDLIKKVKAALP